MRVWRFDYLGTIKDAATFSDTFVLHNNLSEVLLKTRARIKLKAAVGSKTFDYFAVWQGKVFPINDNEIETNSAFDKAFLSRQLDGMVVEL